MTSGINIRWMIPPFFLSSGFACFKFPAFCAPTLCDVIPICTQMSRSLKLVDLDCFDIFQHHVLEFFFADQTRQIVRKDRIERPNSEVQHHQRIRRG